MFTGRSLAVAFLLLATLPALADEATLDRLVAAGDAAADEKNWPEAIRQYNGALTEARAEGRANRLSDIYSALIEAYFAVGDFRRAYPLQKDALERLLEQDQPLVSGHAAMNAAALAVKLRNFREAERQLQFAEVMYTETGLTAELAKIAYYHGVVAQGRREPEAAISHLARSRELYQAAGRPVEAALRLLDVGNVYKEFLSKFDDALKAYDDAATELDALGNRDEALNVRIDKGNTLVDAGRIEAALALLTDTFGKVSRARTPKSWIRAAQMLAKAHYRAGDFRASETLITGIIAALPAVDDRTARGTLEIDAVNLRAMLAAELGRFDAAYRDFDQAIQRAGELDLKGKQAFLRNNVGYWLREQGKPAEAVKEHEAALTLDKELDAPEGISYDLRNLGLAKMAAGDLVYAGKLLAEALDLSVAVGGAYNTAYTYLGLGELKEKLGDHAAAATNFLKAIELAEKSGLRAFAWQAHAGLAEAAWQQGDRKAAREHFKKAIATIDRMVEQLTTEEARRDFRNAPRVKKALSSYEELLRREATVL